jgi:hypothetical protein
MLISRIKSCRLKPSRQSLTGGSGEVNALAVRHRSGRLANDHDPRLARLRGDRPGLAKIPRHLARAAVGNADEKAAHALDVSAAQ